MKPLTFKTFLKEFAIHLVILSLLSMFLAGMLVRSDLFGIAGLKELLKVFPVVAIGLTYSILFFHLFYKKTLVSTQRKNLLVTLLLLVAGYVCADILHKLIPHILTRWPYTFEWFSIGLLFRLFVFTTYAVVSSAIRGSQWLKVQKLAVEKEAASASLQHLRSQIEPHFIFNSLNSIYALSLEEKAAKTSESIEELSSLFRYSLKDNRVEKIPVGEELEFIEKYIHLHRIRIRENKDATIETSLFWDKKPAHIAPMLLITFIENAFKYGLSFRKKSFISIYISVKDARLQLVVKNSVSDDTDTAINGVGLQNTRARLDLLYKGSYTLTERKETSMYEVALHLNLIER